MSTIYLQLLETAIQHLEQLKAEGVRFVSASPEALRALADTPPARSRPALLPPVSTHAPLQSQSASVNKPMRPAEDTLTSKAPVLSVNASPESRLLAPALSGEAKAQAMAELRERALACTRCPHLVAARKSVVFGVGDINSALMFVGEAPGADEDEQGEPFVGRAGQLLTKIVMTMGLTRETVYIGNILKCRPDTPGLSAGNRKPTPQEMETCIPYLHQQIDLIQPKVIVALGGTAVEGLLGKTLGITKLRGQWQTYRATPLMPTFHPSYLLRPENAGQKRKVWEDMLQVMEKLAMPISEKQRGFFLKG
jgi:DNA polymerase